jgi:hypothetical protein
MYRQYPHRVGIREGSVIPLEQDLDRWRSGNEVVVDEGTRPPAASQASLIPLR